MAGLLHEALIRVSVCILYVTITCAKQRCWGPLCLGQLHSIANLVMFIITHLIFTDEDYDKTESPDDLVKVLVNPMIGEVFKVIRT